MVWVIDAEHWPRACLRAELMERGFEVIGFESLPQALSALRHGLYAKPSAMVIDLHHLSLEAGERDALTLLAISKILLVGGVELNETWVKEADWAEVLRRPFAIGQVADAVEGLGKGMVD
jgi:DNA-binding NtrC family response regulator